MPDLRRAHPLTRWITVPVLVTAVAAIARVALWPWLGASAPMMLFLVAVFVAATYAGLAAGLLATVLGIVVSMFLFVPPEMTLAAASTADQLRLVLFAALGVSISLSSARLQRTRRRLEQQVACTQEALTARDAVVERERAAREDAERLARIRDEFAATVSHELRTPANAILGYAVLLRAKDGYDDKTARALETIERNARVQARLIDDLLDLGRILTGELQLEVGTLDLRGVAQRVIEIVGVSARAKGIEVVPDLAAEPVWVTGDPKRIQQMAWNVLSNATKFTDRGGRIEVRVRAGDESATLDVIDTGRGIAPEFLPHVFERFTQQDGSMTRAVGGLGIGLALTRHLAELHGGTIEVTSEGHGRGARVCL
ncbi:MAG: HAMP domain-containing histidine kinase, partial [Myxococcota bacterium]|nr:HAMP domain-containing histidine kinase [Myxococcota bacterium]